MLGIIKKDFYETFCILKNLVGIIVSGLLFLAIPLVSRGAYTFYLITVIIFPLISCSPMQYSLEQDEISKFDDTLLTYPLTKREIILAKFCSCFLFTAICELISFGITMVYVYGFHSVSLRNGMIAWGASFLISLLTMSISNFGFYCLGNKKGNIFYIAFAIIFAFSYVFIYFGIDLLYIFTLDPILLAILGIIISLASLFLSFWGCLKVYTRKHS